MDDTNPTAGGGRKRQRRTGGKGVAGAVAVAAGCKGAGKARRTGGATQGARRGGGGALAGAGAGTPVPVAVLGGADQDFSLRSESEDEEQDEGDVRVGMDEQVLGSGVCSICDVTDGSIVPALGAFA